MLPEEFPVPPHVVTIAWRAVQGDVLLRIDDADCIGADLSILIAAIHHPQALADQQPDTNVREVATHVLEDLPELWLAARTAERQQQVGPNISMRRLRLDLRREGSQLRISPGSELMNLGLTLEIFAKAVLNPDSEDARTARGAIAYSASAWSRELGEATGALPANGHVPATGRSDNRPPAAPEPPPFNLAP